MYSICVLAKVKCPVCQVRQLSSSDTRAAQVKNVLEYVAWLADRQTWQQVCAWQPQMIPLCLGLSCGWWPHALCNHVPIPTPFLKLPGITVWFLTWHTVVWLSIACNSLTVPSAPNLINWLFCCCISCLWVFCVFMFSVTSHSWILCTKVITKENLYAFIMCTLCRNKKSWT